MKLFSLFALCAVLGLAMSTAFAADKKEDSGKEMTVKGTMTCAKCGLHETEKCQNAIQVKDGDKTVTYYMQDNAVSKAKHGEVCKTTKEGVSVTGMVTEKDGKKMIAPTKIE